MRRVLTYHQTSFDTAYIPPGQPVKARFFHPDARRDGSPSVTQFDEKTLVRWLMQCAPARRILCGTLGLDPSVCSWREVVRPFYCPGERDIDLILCPLQNPSEAVAIECKLVKVEIVNPESDDMNKLNDTAKGVRQANGLYDKYAFHRTYLAIITAVEASQQVEWNVPTRGLRSDSSPDYGDTRTFTRIVEFPGREDLKPEIGIVFVEIVQPSGISIDRRATIRVCVDYPPQPRPQADAVTNRLAALIREGCNS